MTITLSQVQQGAANVVPLPLSQGGTSANNAASALLALGGQPSGNYATGGGTATGNNTGDQVLPTTLPASDVSAWAKAGVKPTYTAIEVGLGNVTNTSDADKPVSTAQATAIGLKLDASAAYIHPANHAASVITQDSSNRFVTDAEKSAWDAKGVGDVTLTGSQTLTNKTLTTPFLSNSPSGFYAGALGYSFGKLSFGNGTVQKEVVDLDTGQRLLNKTLVNVAVLGPSNDYMNDHIRINGRSGGVSAYEVEIVPAVLTATRTATLPDASGTVVLTTATQTLTNKTISGADNTLTVDGTNEVGFRHVPQQDKTSAYELVLTDAGKHIHKGGTGAFTVTIPANASVAFPIGTAITFVNSAASGVMTIAITTDTLRLAGTGTTASKQLAAYGVATAIKVAATLWMISGSGLT